MTKKISELDAADPLTGTEQTVVVQGGVTKRSTAGGVSAVGTVALTGAQTVAGVKTFSSSPVVPAPTTDLQAATKEYVDDRSNLPISPVAATLFRRPLGSATGTHAAPALNRTYYTHFLVEEDEANYKTLSAVLQAAGNAGTTVRLGLWRATADGYPGELLVDSGGLDAESPGAKNYDYTPAALSRGLYVGGLTVQGGTTLPSVYTWNVWLGFGTNTTATIFRNRPLTTASITGAYASNPGVNLEAVNGATFAMLMQRE